MRRAEQQLSLELRSLVTSYRSRDLGKPELRNRGEQIIRKHYDRNTGQVDIYLRNRGITLNSGESPKLRQILNDKLRDWNNIVTILRLP